jgi:hypothetical protein
VLLLYCCWFKGVAGVHAIVGVTKLLTCCLAALLLQVEGLWLVCMQLSVSPVATC